MSQSQGSKAVVAAMSANLAIAVLKLVAWAVTGAASLLAEAVHSVADSANQVVLMLGGRSARKQATADHPFGYGRERYISAFLVGIILFSMGGLFALYEAWHKFLEVRAGHPNALLQSRWWWVALVILAGSIVAEGLSFRTAWREAQAVRGQDSLPQFIRRSRSPELPVVLLEDSAALIGLTVALLGVTLTKLTGNGYFDVVGSGLIGALLVVVALIVAVEVKSLLLGESARPEAQAAIARAIQADPAITGLIHLKTLHLGPDSILVAAKIAVPETVAANDLSRVIDAAEARVRAVEPMVGPIYLEPDIWRQPPPAAAPVSPPPDATPTASPLPASPSPTATPPASPPPGVTPPASPASASHQPTVEPEV
ncbi:MAG: cation diffusion facilitator family transporter [Propionibacteriaceae bacterium]|nr:cation diffusion facilitator family transporter [Propionibacteriaceae bacterium]